MPQVVVTRKVAAPRDAVEKALGEPVTTSFADPVAPDRRAGVISFSSVPDVVEDVVREVRVREEDGGCVLKISARYSDRVPYFGWVFGPLIKRAILRSCQHMARVVEARARGTLPPKAPRRRFWMPPDQMTRDQTRVIATLCAILAITAYGGSLYSHTVSYIATSFDSTGAGLGFSLAITRLGTLVGLVGSVASDKRGRRMILLISTVGLCLMTVASAFAPNIQVFTTLQIFVRGFANLAGVVAFIAAAEEAPEGARAYILAFASIAAALGFSLGALLLPIADLGEPAWKILFLVGGLWLVLTPGLRKRLSESRRFVAMGDRIKKARGTEVVDATYGGRFLIVAITVFLMGLLAAPTSQLMNLYLADERGYSGLGILVLRAVTQAIPALVAVIIGGRLAESSGRKPVAARSTFVMAFSTAIFFLVGGPVLWVMLLVSTAAGALAGPSFAAFNTELFPTEVRGTAGGWLLAVAVAGSVTGLLISGLLADPLGSVGRAIAVTAVGPLIVSLFLVKRLPEAAGLNLDDLSPPEV